MVDILNWPLGIVPAPKTATWRLVANTQQHVSPLDQTVQTLELVGARWSCDATWSGLKPDEWRAFEAFIARLRGAAGRFKWWPPHAWTPRGSMAGAPQVVGPNQSGSSLTTQGWTPNSANVLRTGDFISIATSLGVELKVVRADVSSDAAGRATITFDPPLRRAPLEFTAIEGHRAKVLMRLADDNQGAFDHEEGGFAGLSLQTFEVF
jgi:hypothetical protein